jgi:hypothetical protein
MRKPSKSDCVSLDIYRIFKPESSMIFYNSVVVWIGMERRYW